MDNLIKIYNNAINPDICQFIIDKFENSQNLVEGMSGGGVKKSIKSSTDLMIHDERYKDEDWEYIYNYLMENLLSHLVDYLEYNDFPVLSSNFSSKSSAVRTAQTCFMSGNNGNPHIQMQRYVGGEGYYAWHHENEGGNTSNRELFYIYYLNTLNTGGTEIKYNPQIIYPETGKLIIAPAYWTHKHRGNAPGDGNTKYIITGWIESKPNKIYEEFETDYLI
jgi:hypothetical protein